MLNLFYTFIVVSLNFFAASPAMAQVEQIWLTHRSQTPDHLVVSWTTKQPGPSSVQYWVEGETPQRAYIDGERVLHHVEIPVFQSGKEYHYLVQSGDQQSSEATFKSLPTDVLRVAVIADTAGRPDLSALLKDDPHLLLTAGDHITGLWKECGPGEKECIIPFLNWIGAYPELFHRVPVMPVLGNHDREIRPRTNQPPPEPVYDIDAIAFRKIFKLPGEGWKWSFNIPQFQVRFIALDLNHLRDYGTTWQSCHRFDENSEQMKWYQELVQQAPEGFRITLYNAQNRNVRAQAKGEWQSLFSSGTACISGFGHFAERAEIGDTLYYNTALIGRGDKYPDPHSQAFFSENNYLLMTFEKNSGEMAFEIKTLQGVTLDRTTRRHGHNQ